jgi:hypothetical protein
MYRATAQAERQQLELLSSPVMATLLPDDPGWFCLAAERLRAESAEHQQNYFEPEPASVLWAPRRVIETGTM